MQKKPSRHQTLIDIREAQVSFGTFHALRDISLSIQKGDRIGLVGPNGAGKSTLMRLLAGKVAADAGTVELSANMKVGYLPQVTSDDDRAGSGKSGGEKTKLILSKLFSTQHDLYLLDEPTNNLDADGLAWLDREIGKPSNEPAAFVIVSHDRDFLDRTAGKIIEVSELTRSARLLECTYSEYRDIRSKETEDQWKKYGETVEEKQRLRKSTEQRGEWIRKIERARANNRKMDPGEKEKPVAAILRDKEGRMGQRAKSVRKRLDSIIEDLGELPKPETRLPINLEFEEAERSGEVVFRLKDVRYSYRRKTREIGPITFECAYGERVHIAGKNGAGKSTLIKILLGDLSPASGDMLTGSRVHVGYLPQEDSLQPEENVIDAVCRILGVVRDDRQEGLFRMTLKRFGFEEEDAKKNIGHLSSGEKSRLQLALMKMMKPNCIILDEPTNHLDIESVEALEIALQEFKGTLIVVSHDRRFVERVGFTREFKM